MVIRLVNVILIITMVISAVLLVGKRYQARLSYEHLANLQDIAEQYNKDYTRLQLEEGTFSSRLVLQNYAISKLGLIEPDKKHMAEVNQNVSK